MTRHTSTNELTYIPVNVVYSINPRFVAEILVVDTSAQQFNDDPSGMTKFNDDSLHRGDWLEVTLFVAANAKPKKIETELMTKAESEALLKRVVDAANGPPTPGWAGVWHPPIVTRASETLAAARLGEAKVA